MFDLVAQLCDPHAYATHDLGFEPETKIGHLETHISHLFFVNDTVYKVKKPVDLEFLNYTTLAARRHYCEEEVRLNRRLAKDIYRGVVTIRQDKNGQLRVGCADGKIVDYAVQMHRLPVEGMLDQLLKKGDIDNKKMREIAKLLAKFHQNAATGKNVDEFGTPESIRTRSGDNLRQGLQFTHGPDSTLTPHLHGFLTVQTKQFLEENLGLLESRVTSGKIREGHGDLHAGNICMFDDQIIIYDCIEFSREFRCGDVAADLAFLLMDLDLHGFRAFANYLAHRYASLTDDPDLFKLLDFYKSYRAFVRGKVMSMQALNLRGKEREKARRAAMRYFHLAGSYGLGPALIVLCGLPGSGKSHIATTLGQPFEAVVLNTDSIRKQLAGMQPTDRSESGIDSDLYASDRSERVYAELLHRSAKHLQASRSVIVDGGFRREARRTPFRKLARDLEIAFVLVHVDTPEPIILQRLQTRATDPNEVSDAGITVYRALALEFEPPDEIPATQLIAYDGQSARSELTSDALDCIIQQVT